MVAMDELRNYSTDGYSSFNIFKNKEQLIRRHNFKSFIDSLAAFEYAFTKCNPYIILKKNIQLDDSSLLTVNDVHKNSRKFQLQEDNSFLIISVGKASVNMLKAVLEILNNKVKKCLLITPSNQKISSDLINPAIVNIIKSSHPLPNRNSLIASKKAISCLHDASKKDVIIFLISGGSSSLIASPMEIISLYDKVQITNLLISCGANIREINIVRRHLSNIKGGKILNHINRNCLVLSFILSDVIGDFLNTIGSGLTSFDDSTFRDAKTILERYGLLHIDIQSAKNINKAIEMGIEQKIPETMKKNELSKRKVHNFILGNNSIFCKYVADYIKSHNYHISFFRLDYENDLQKFVIETKGVITEHLKKNSCVLVGGEITLNILNNKHNVGIGGRNQEGICHLLDFFSSIDFDDFTVMFLGTDGIDGNSKAAGGFITPTTIKLLREKKLNSVAYLKKHDSYNLLKSLHSNIITGYTGTNFNDVYLFLRR